MREAVVMFFVIVLLFAKLSPEKYGPFFFCEEEGKIDLCFCKEEIKKDTSSWLIFPYAGTEEWGAINYIEGPRDVLFLIDSGIIISIRNNGENIPKERWEYSLEELFIFTHYGPFSIKDLLVYFDKDALDESWEIKEDIHGDEYLLKKDSEDVIKLWYAFDPKYFLFRAHSMTINGEAMSPDVLKSFY